MLKVPTADICIESPRQSEYVNIVCNEKESNYMLGHGSYGRVYKAVYRGFCGCIIVTRNMVVNHNLLFPLNVQVNQLL